MVERSAKGDPKLETPFETSSAAPASLPLFFKHPMPLDFNRHGAAGLLPSDDVAFALEANSIPVNAVEFVEAAKHYPIVFTQSPMVFPAVIVGLEKQNYFVDNKQHWQAGSYIPAYVRKYPFVFMEVPERQEFVLCVDEAAAQYKEKSDQKIYSFYDGTQPSALTKNALEFCTAFQNHHQFTRLFCDALQQAGLLMPSRSDAKLNNGREIQLSGFQIIDEKKFTELSDDVILEFHKSQWLPLIYFALMSTSNWKKMVDLAATRDAA